MLMALVAHLAKCREHEFYAGLVDAFGKARLLNIRSAHRSYSMVLFLFNIGRLSASNSLPGLKFASICISTLENLFRTHSLAS